MSEEMIQYGLFRECDLVPERRIMAEPFGATVIEV